MNDVFTKSASFNSMTCLEVRNVTPAVHAFLSQVMRENRMGHRAYELRSACSAFFQSGHDPTIGYVLIEFWSYRQDRIDAFVSYLNEQWSKIKGPTLRLNNPFLLPS